MKILLAANWGELAECIEKAVLNYERRESKLAANQTCPTRKGAIPYCQGLQRQDYFHSEQKESNLWGLQSLTPSVRADNKFSIGDCVFSGSSLFAFSHIHNLRQAKLKSLAISCHFSFQA